MAKGEAVDGALVERARAGDARAREQILTRLESPLRAFFIHRIGYRSEVDDLVQNTLLRVHSSLPDLKHPARLKGFAMKAALFELQDLYRGRYSTKERLYDPEFPPDFIDGDPGAGTRLDIERALDTLSPKAREIIELRESGYRYEEIAEMIGSTEAAIKMQVKRAFDRLRDVLVCVALAAMVLASMGPS
jgi:RNA polymerase sigma-70 factor, ECF subfamily